MRLEIRSQTFSLTEAICAHVKKRVDHALDRVMSRISVVEVRLADINGPRGGPDKECGVVVQLTDGQMVVVRETDTSVYRVVDHAMKRVKRVVGERLKQSQLRRRSRETIRGLGTDVADEREVRGPDSPDWETTNGLPMGGASSASDSIREWRR